MYKRIKIPETEKAAEIVLTSGPVHFLGDGTYIVPFETLVRLNEEKIPFQELTYVEKPQTKDTIRGKGKRKS